MTFLMGELHKMKATDFGLTKCSLVNLSATHMTNEPDKIGKV